MIESSDTTKDTVVPQKNKKNRLLLLLLLLLLPIFLFLGIWISPLLNTSTDPVEQEEKLGIEQIQTQSDSLYRALQAEMEFYKSQSDSLYPEINAREEELEKQYIRLQNLIKQAKQDKSSSKEIDLKLQDMRAELNRMRQFVDDQTLDLAEMRRANVKLLAERNDFSEKYQKEKSDKEKLENENSKLESQKNELAEKVDKASILQIVNISTTAAKLTAKGVDKEIDIARKAEFLKICFDVVRNDVVRSGINKFYVAITDPSGQPIIVDSRGSGKIANVEHGTEVFFTTMKSFNYNADFKDLCITWSQDPQKPFEKGNYQIDVYNQGFKVGSSSLLLK